MPHLTTSIEALHREGYEWLDIGLSDEPDLASQVLGRRVTTKQAFEHFYSLADLGMAGQYSEGATIPASNITSPYNAKFFTVMNALAFETSKAATFADVYNKLRSAMPLLGRGIRRRSNYNAQALLFGGYTAPVNGGTDYVDKDSGTTPLFGEHSLPGSGGTYRNAPAVALALTYANVVTSLTALRKQVDHNGLPLIIAGPVDLFVPPDLELVAQGIVTSSGQYGTADRNDNVIRSRLTVQVLDYATASVHSSRYWLVAKGPNNPFARIQLIPLFYETEYMTARQVYYHVAGEQYVDMARTWRGTQGSG